MSALDKLADLAKALAKAKDAIESLEKASDELSNKGLEKLTKNVKSLIEAQQLLTAEQLDAITDFRSLTSEIGKLEKRVQDYADAEEKARDKVLQKMQDEYSSIARDLKDIYTDEAELKAKLSEIEEDLKSQLEDRIKTELKLRDFKEDEIDRLKIQLPLLKEQSVAIANQIKKTDAFSKEIETFSGAVRSNVAKWATVGFGLKKLGDSVMTTYDQMSSLSSKGLLGSFAEMNITTQRLLLSFKDYEEIINRNRDVINQLGGGIKGVRAFADQLADASKNLEFLGPNAGKAGARFLELTKNIGINIKDEVQYGKAMNGFKDQFTEFAGLFGDSYEDYAQLIEQQALEENFKTRLNGMSKDAIQAQLVELRNRTENNKLMGLSNAQIVEFNKRLEEMYNPRKNTQVQRRTEAISFTNQQAEMMRVLSSNPMGMDPKEFQSLQDDLQTISQNSQTLANIHVANDPNALKAFQATPEGKKYFQAMGRAIGAMSNIRGEGKDFLPYLYNSLGERAGGLGAYVNDRAFAVQGAKLSGKDISDKPREELDKLRQTAIDTAKGLTDYGVDLGKTFTTLSYAITGVKNLLENPFSQAIMGVTAALYVAAKAAIDFAMAQRAATAGTKFGGSWGGGGYGKYGKMLKWGGLAAAGIDLGISGYSAYSANEDYKNGKISEADRNINYWSNGGNVLGTLLGGGIGFFLGGPIGATAGGALGGMAGDYVGGKLGYYRNKNDSSKSQVPSEVFPTLPKVGQGGNPPSNMTGLNSDQTASYLNALSQRESGGDYSKENSYGYLGKYQFGADALADLGMVDVNKLNAAKAAAGGNFYNSGAHKAFLANPGNWLQGSKSTFLGNPQLQEQLNLQLQNKRIQQGMNSGALNNNSSPGDIAAYAMAAHLKGPGGANNLMLRGIDSSDGYGTRTSTYANIGRAAVSGYSVPNAGSIPTPNTTNMLTGITTPAAATSASAVQVSGGPGNDYYAKNLELLAQIATNTRPSIKTSAKFQADPAAIAAVVG